MAKKEIVHHDKLGKELKVGDYVACSGHNEIMIAAITKLNPKMISVQEVGKRYVKHKYPIDSILLDGPEVTMYILKNQK